MSPFVRTSLVVCVAVVAQSQTAPGAEPGAWRPVAGWPQLPPEIKRGAVSATAVNSRGEVFLFHRGKHPIIVCDVAGKYLRSWGDDLIDSAHGLRIDARDDVWVTDIGNHRVFKFDAEGKLLMTLGTGRPGDGPDQFNKPTDTAIGERGEFYVTDGYGNARVLKFSPSGALVGSWGSAGTGRGQFRVPHAVVRDRAGRILVGDRENDRIQIFDADGKLLDVWPGFAPYGLAFDAAGTLYVADGRAHQVLELDAAGRVVRRFGGHGTEPGRFDLPHMLTFDAAGELYVAEINGARIQKFTRR